MPFRSEAQRRYLWMEHPDIARKWAHGEHSTSGPHKMPARGKNRNLPYHSRSGKNRSRKMSGRR